MFAQNVYPWLMNIRAVLSKLTWRLFDYSAYLAGWATRVVWVDTFDWTSDMQVHIDDYRTDLKPVRGLSHFRDPTPSVDDRWQYSWAWWNPDDFYSYTSFYRIINTQPLLTEHSNNVVIYSQYGHYSEGTPRVYKNYFYPDVPLDNWRRSYEGPGANLIKGYNVETYPVDNRLPWQDTYNNYVGCRVSNVKTYRQLKLNFT
jgi:hypothetical protein